MLVETPSILVRHKHRVTRTGKVSDHLRMDYFDNTPFTIFIRYMIISCKALHQSAHFKPFFWSYYEWLFELPRVSREQCDLNGHSFVGCEDWQLHRGVSAAGREELGMGMVLICRQVVNTRALRPQGMRRQLGRWASPPLKMR